jgi:hypothetical protein
MKREEFLTTAGRGRPLLAHASWKSKKGRAENEEVKN